MEPLRQKDPKTIGPYTLIGRLGAGGMGIVYLATRGSDSVALKVIRESLIDDPSEATRFTREIEALQRIDSPHVARILASGVDDDRAWFATEFVNGPNLKSLVSDKGPLPEQSWLKLAHGLLEGLKAIHSAGIIHRDVKPGNVIMAESGPKLIDFGIAQVSDATSVTSSGLIAGSPAWFSPEQIEGQPLTSSTDLFSAGSVLVFAATGQSPWGVSDDTSKAQLFGILVSEPNLSGLSDFQTQIVGPLLNKTPSLRQTPSPGLNRLPQKPSISNKADEIVIAQPATWSKSRLQKASRPQPGRAIKLGSAAILTILVIAGSALLFPQSSRTADSENEVSTAQRNSSPQPQTPEEFLEGLDGVEVFAEDWDGVPRILARFDDVPNDLNDFEVALDSVSPAPIDLGLCESGAKLGLISGTWLTGWFGLTCIGIDKGWQSSEMEIAIVIDSGNVRRRGSFTLRELAKFTVSRYEVTEEFMNISLQTPTNTSASSEFSEWVDNFDARLAEARLANPELEGLEEDFLEANCELIFDVENSTGATLKLLVSTSIEETTAVDRFEESSSRLMSIQTNLPTSSVIGDAFKKLSTGLSRDSSNRLGAEEAYRSVRQELVDLSNTCYARTWN